MNKCIDDNLGILIHAYELGILEAQDIERFQIHMLECQFCFSQVQQFEEYIDALRFGDSAREAVAKTDQADTVPASRFEKFRHMLWPRKSILLRPATAYLLVLLMVLPAFFGIKHLITDSSKIRPAQAIHLTPIRMKQISSFKMRSGQDGIISFAIPNSETSTGFSVKIIDEHYHTIMAENHLTNINSSGMGELIFPFNRMGVGEYRLIVYGETEQTATDSAEYRFTIIE